MMEWLSGIVGDNAAHIISFIGLFALFLIGVFVVFAVIKRMTAGTYVSKPHDTAPRLTVTDAAAVDGQRRLVLVRRDDVEHLILIGGPTDIVIEQNIIRHKRENHENAAPRAQRPAIPAQIPVQAATRAVAAEQSFSPSADIISAVPTYKPEPQAIITRPEPEAIITRPEPEAIITRQEPQAIMTQQEPQATNSKYEPEAMSARQQPEAMIARPRVEAPVQAPAQPAPPSSQPLQTHAQQVAAARQQQASHQQALQQTQRPAAPRIAEPSAPKLHPVYPLGQVSRGVIAATSGLAAANNAAQQEMIAAAKRENRGTTPSLDDVRPGSNQGSAETSPLVLQRATPQLSRPVQQEPSIGSTFTQQPDLERDLEKAVAQALSADSEMSLEDLLSSEMEQHFAKNEKTAPTPAEVKKPQNGTLNISPRE